MMNIQEYYNNYDEESRLLTRYGAMEFVTTMHFIKKYLTPHARVIEIGAGTGRYCRALAKQGFSVDAVELVEHNIEVFQSQLSEDMDCRVYQGNALDLSAFESEQYDITLLLGPLYHLYTQAEQRQALSEAVRVTKQDGVILCAYCMGDASLLTYGFEKGYLHEIMHDCALDDTFAVFQKPWGVFQLYRVEDIIRLRNTLNVEPLHLVGADGYANHMRAALEDMDEETYQLYLQYHLAACEREELLGFSHHILDIFRKR